mmetsp:Transcript_25063/g.52670  ORF Transcript_25063/g.52670 Transcript_25063/m.52670 type:complete len:80 (-) Transcript_25063:162-401(-)
MLCLSPDKVLITRLRSKLFEPVDQRRMTRCTNHTSKNNEHKRFKKQNVINILKRYDIIEFNLSNLSENTLRTYQYEVDD